MRTKYFLLFLGLIILVPISNKADWKYEFKGVEYNYVYRKSNILSNTYMQFAEDISFHPTWMNISAGLEFDATWGEFRRFYLSNRFQIDKSHSFVLKLNHLEYPDWYIGVNMVSLSLQRSVKSLDWALGICYEAPQVGSLYNDPFAFDSELNAIRILYSVAYHRGFFQDRTQFRIGLNNFNNFENFQYEQLGPSVNLGFQLTKHLKGVIAGDARLSAIGAGTPFFERYTLIGGFQWETEPATNFFFKAKQKSTSLKEGSSQEVKPH